MHKVKALVVTVSLIGIAATASLAHGTKHHSQASCSPAVQRQHAIRYHHNGPQVTVTYTNRAQTGRRDQALTLKRHDAKCHAQYNRQVTIKQLRKSELRAQRMAMKARQQQPSQCGQQATTVNYKVVKVYRHNTRNHR